MVSATKPGIIESPYIPDKLRRFSPFLRHHFIQIAATFTTAYNRFGIEDLLGKNPLGRVRLCQNACCPHAYLPLNTGNTRDPTAGPLPGTWSCIPERW